jgi:hypothetical protein
MLPSGGVASRYSEAGSHARSRVIRLRLAIVESGILARSLRLAYGRVEAGAFRLEKTLQWLLRVGCFMCFVGHGAWGVITKAGWLPFYGVFGIQPALAWKTMPLIGSVDIALGLIALLFPFRALLAYLIFWTVFTALLRPLAGMGWWEFIERGGNYGPPLALFLIASQESGGWFTRLEVRPLSAGTLRRVAWALRFSIALLLIGHGGFALFQEKKLLLQHWRSLGIPADKAFLHVMGAAEMAAGAAVLLRPSRALLLVVAYWKIASEILYPVAGTLTDGWEWFERGGDYMAPFALICVLALLDERRARTETTALS